MTTFVGILVVIGSILAGFAMEKGNFFVLFQPAEVLIVGGAGLGSLIVMAPPKLFRKIVHAIPTLFQSANHSKEVSLELMGLLYEVFSKVKRDGALAIERDVEEPEQSGLFRNYPAFLKNRAAVTLLCDTLRLMLLGASIRPHELDDLMTTEIETHEEEEGRISGALTTLADAFPGLGIVAAVLGVIVTMGKMSEPPEVIGHSIAAALVGTFMGVLLCYGVVGPLAKHLEQRHQSERKLLEAIKTSLLAFSKDMPPRIAVEFGRRVLLEDDKPDYREVEQRLKKR
ncbi:MAG: flagellar motor stator protein MotA [bacterium]